MKLNNFNFKNQSSIFKNLNLLVFKSFVKDSRNYVFMIIMPIFLTTIFFYVFDKRGATVFSYALLPCLTIITSLTPSIVEWKNSVFLKRIDITGVKKSMFIASVWFVYLLAGIVCYLIILVYGLILASVSLKGKDFIEFQHMFSTIKYGYLVFSIFLVCITSIAIATFLGGLANAPGAIQGIVMIVYFITMFLSGVMLPPQLIYSSKVLVIATYLIPHKYCVFLYLHAMNPGGWKDIVEIMPTQNPMSFQGAYNSFTQSWQPIIGSILALILLFITTIKTFKWTAKR
ncbi:ABC transporter permease [Mesoplasma corruscae]|uniref:ABC transporter ATP-binding protein n=1 Tax=Mesoplasma corruscae TaxID=216874 RepID=A0A2S5RHC6_9MOLU|nr:ABC transporter permease [Mesoplasma corruscae]PPE06701.1 ABC transporter ATP-binding protein [Mesoplasma corruscae]